MADETTTPAKTPAELFAAEPIDTQLAFLFGAVSQLQAAPAPEAIPDVSDLTASIARLNAHIFGANG